MNLNRIVFNEDLTVKTKTEQPIRAYAQQANTIEVLAPVSGFNTAYIVLQGLANSVVNPRLRATQRLFMSPLTAEGDYSRWNMIIPGAILNDMSLMNSTGVRVRAEFWYISGDCLGVEKYNTEVALTIKGYLAADYPDATDGQFVRVIDTNTDWYYDADTLTWVDYEDQHQIGVSVEPTSSVDFLLEKGIYTDAPSHAPTNTELILQELAAKLGLIGGTMSGDIDMDDNDINNVKTVVFYNTNGTAVLSFDGTNLLLNRNAVDEEVMTVLNEIGDLANVVITSATNDDILIYNGTNWVNITKTAYLAAVNGRIDTNVSDIADRELLSNKVNEVVVSGTTDQYVNASALYNKFLTKVDKTQTIIGLDLQDNILIGEFRTALGNATQSVAGLLSAEDKTHLDGLIALLETSDGNNVVDTIGEILHIFENYPEGANILEVLNDKVEKIEGKGLSENDYTDIDKNKVNLSYTHSEIVDKSNPHNTSFANITDKPTTRDGFGITDVYTKPETYTQQEINALLDNLSAVKGLKSTLLTPTELSNGNTISTNLLTNNGAYVVFTATDTSTGEIDSDTVPVSTIITGKKFVFFDNQEIVFTIGETNSTFETSEAITLKINLLYLDDENVQAISVDFDGSLTNYLENQENVQSAINKLDEELKTTNDNSSNHITDMNNPHLVTATQVGLGNVDNTSDLDKPISTLTQNALNDKSNVSHNHDDSYYTEEETNTLLNTKLNTSLKGAVNGLAELGSDGKVLSDQLPSYVDDVLEYANLTAFPANGESGKIYVALDTNKTYRWSGSGYTEISASLALGETSSTAGRGDWTKTAYDHTFLTNNPHSVTKEQVGLSNVDNTSDLDKPVSTAQQTALNDKVDKITGKGLSTEDYTTTEKNKLAGLTVGLTVDTWNTDTKTLALSDANKLIVCLYSTNQTLTIPTSTTVAFPIGTMITFLLASSYTVTFVGASGVTLNSVDSLVTLATPEGMASLIKIAGNAWQLVGALE